jgi:hypothetical protein
MIRLLLLLVLMAPAAGCMQTSIAPLVGEGPEILKLLDAEAPEDPATSALVAARRLHQALIQQDMELAWALLAAPTQEALDRVGSVVGMSGRELLDASSLPAPGGSIQKVQFASILIGPKAIDLVASESTAGHQSRRVIKVVCSDGSGFERTFERDDTGWKLLMASIPGTESQE